MVTFTVATWNLAKRTRAVNRLPELLAAHDIDLLLAQEAGPLITAPGGYQTVNTRGPSPDTRILARNHLHVRPINPSPLARFGSYACVATASIAGNEYLVASVHALARAALLSELNGLDPDQVRRPDVDVPWVNDLAFHLLDPVVRDRRFILGADLNTSRLFPDGGPTFFDRAGQAGWVDLVHRVHGDQVPTFRTRRSHRHQLDYLFTDEETAGQVADVSADVSVTDRDGDGSSDHAMVIASFKLDG